MKIKRLLSAVLLLMLTFGILGICAGAAATPEAPTIKASNYVSNGNLRLTWNTAEGANYYKLYRSTTETGGYSCIKTTSSTGYTDTTAKVGTTYYYCVKSVAGSNVSASSNKVSAARKLARPDVTLSGINSSGKIKVSWTAVSGAESYRVYRSTDKSSWTLLKTTTSTAYTDTDAEAGVLYYYRVRAVASKSAGNSAYSSAKSRTCDLPRPVVSVSTVSSTGRVKLSWKAIDGAVRYRVYRATSKSGTYTKIKSPTETSFTDTTATAGKTYYYKVMAVASNSSANSAYSAIKSGKFVYPDGLTLSAELDESGKPYLSWNEVKGATKYKVYRSFMKTGGYSLLATRTANYYPNSSAQDGLTFYYKVKAVNSSGKVLETSNVASVTTKLTKEETLKTRYVAVPMIKLYTAPTVESDAIELRYMEKLQRGVSVLSNDSGAWYRVFYNGKLMYLHVASGETVLTGTRSPDSYTGKTQIQQEVLDLAMEIANNWNTVYAHEQSNGVANPDGTYGFDCSGFVEYVLETVMRKRVPTYNISAAISVMHATTGIYNVGYPGEVNARKVTLENIQPGDIIFFKCAADGSASSSIGHCGIYLGNNEFVHSTTSWSDAVCVMPLNDRFLETMHSIRRYLPTSVTSADTQTTLSGPYRNYKVYAEMDPNSDVVTTIAEGETFTLLFTDSGSWAYVRTKSGKEGFTRAEYLA